MMILYLHSKELWKKPKLSDHYIKKIIRHFKNVGFNIDIMRQSRFISMVYCLLINNCPGVKLSSFGWCLMFVFAWADSGST